MDVLSRTGYRVYKMAAKLIPIIVKKHFNEAWTDLKMGQTVHLPSSFRLEDIS